MKGFIGYLLGKEQLVGVASLYFLIRERLRIELEVFQLLFFRVRRNQINAAYRADSGTYLAVL